MWEVPCSTNRPGFNPDPSGTFGIANSLATETLRGWERGRGLMRTTSFFAAAPATGKAI